ncbi:MAG: hypothetical protein ACRDAO_02580 [Culicoidibacterales bacterium]
MIHSNFYKFLGWIHVTVVFSLLFSILSLASAGFLFLPLLAVGFELSKEIIERGFDPHVSVVKYVYMRLKLHIRLFRFNAVYIVLLLNGIGTLLGIFTQQSMIMYSCSVLAVLAFIFLIYIAFYATWIQPSFQLINVFIFMFYKLQYVLVLFVFFVSCVYFSQSIIFLAFIFLNFLAILFVSVLLNSTSVRYCHTILQKEEI